MTNQLCPSRSVLSVFQSDVQPVLVGHEQTGACQSRLKTCVTPGDCNTHEADTHDLTLSKYIRCTCHCKRRSSLAQRHFPSHLAVGLPVVSTSSDHADVAQLKLDKLFGLAGLNVQHDGVIHLMHAKHAYSASQHLQKGNQALYFVCVEHQ